MSVLTLPSSLLQVSPLLEAGPGPLPDSGRGAAGLAELGVLPAGVRHRHRLLVQGAGKGDVPAAWGAGGVAAGQSVLFSTGSH